VGRTLITTAASAHYRPASAEHRTATVRQPGETVACLRNRIAPHFYSSDVARSKAFYDRVLGFSLDYSDGEPPHYVVMCRDDVYVHLSLPGPPATPRHPGAGFIAVAGVESLWAQVATHRDYVVTPLTNADYGAGIRFRVFVVRDPDGNLLRIGEPQSAGSP
jgi:catechol 2,3-dioxygenase-like lactoylglutathione lyase family enzyme